MLCVCVCMLVLGCILYLCVCMLHRIGGMAVVLVGWVVVWGVCILSDAYGVVCVLCEMGGCGLCREHALSLK